MRSMRYTAVDDEFDSGDVAAFVTRKIDCRPGYIPSVAAKPHWHALAPRPVTLLPVLILGEESNGRS
jgi:hypothetical protein